MQFDNRPCVADSIARVLHSMFPFSPNLPRLSLPPERDCMLAHSLGQVASILAKRLLSSAANASFDAAAARQPATITPNCLSYLLVMLVAAFPFLDSPTMHLYILWDQGNTLRLSELDVCSSCW